tara:strand:+ start:40 stop:531 length:492 start_codon:yes stop_codon:yes gene_type:complete
MKKLFLLFIFIILNNCGGFEFVYKTNDNIFLLKDITKISVNGDSTYDIYVSLKDVIGNNENNPKYILIASSTKTETADSINKDATASKFIIKYSINYDLYNLHKNCTVFYREIATTSIYNTKSAGYSFGTNLSQKESNIKNINNNINNFITFTKISSGLEDCL